MERSRTTVAAGVLLMAVSSIGTLGCLGQKDTDGESKAGREPSLHEAVMETVDLIKLRDPSVAKWFENAHGYAVFPGIGAGGFILGGGYGTGEVFVGGSRIGTAKVTQLNIGATVGGQVTRQIIFFRDKLALDSFTRGGFEFDAAASAVAIKSGAAASANYNNGVAVFVMPKQGAMVQASLGTQRFTFTAD